ncbi:hypothetical protein PSE10C_15050 [Pseudomonas amygdali pv. eriobotryae]|uniref:Uncharacterized protein n=1 Tax=Pseudomonas amygdali pv. eriobotryae TaxID=129137 RepID=A0A9P3AE41_PSEA0|nr:hypothetical protein Pta6605_24760 [Pseudomonas amygdali pv. tabaci]GFZ60567.1 hypothetical protein PSE10A_30780 [Pseudomonas amygdali pv. eriobotryae]GFZ70763.1 hypothetical protein PSE10C_15050 [Pseudomonas amygdali pv. eriobotryae]
MHIPAAGLVLNGTAVIGALKMCLAQCAKHRALYPGDIDIHETGDVGIRQTVEPTEQKYLPGTARKLAKPVAEFDDLRRGLRLRQAGGEVQQRRELITHDVSLADLPWGLFLAMTGIVRDKSRLVNTRIILK